MYQPGFIRGNKCTILMRDVDSEGVVLGWGVEGIWDTLCFPLYFAVNLKSLKKKKKLFIRRSTGGQSRRSQRDPGTARVTGAEGRHVWAAEDSQAVVLYTTASSSNSAKSPGLGKQNSILGIKHALIVIA